MITHHQTQRTTVAGAILAAGGGSRFDGTTHKLLSEFRGRPLVSYALESALAAGFDDLYVATGAVELGDLLSHRVTEVKVPDWAEGQARSLKRVIEQASKDGHGAVVVGLGDQPLVPTSAWRSVGASSGEIVVATFDGDRRPPVKLAKSVWSELDGEGDFGARVLMGLRPELVCEVPCSGNPVDIDTTEDLRQWN